LAVFLLKMTAHEEVELLIGAAELEVGFERHRVVALHQRIEELMHRNRLAGLEALAEIVALHHSRHGVLGRQLDHSARAEWVAPFGVVANLGLGGVQHQAGLAVVGLGVGFDLLAGERRARAVAAGRIPDGGREVADQEDHGVTKILELAHFVQHHRVADMDVRRGRVQAQLDSQRCPVASDRWSFRTHSSWGRSSSVPRSEISSARPTPSDRLVVVTEAEYMAIWGCFFYGGSYTEPDF